MNEKITGVGSKVSREAFIPREDAITKFALDSRW